MSNNNNTPHWPLGQESATVYNEDWTEVELKTRIFYINIKAGQVVTWCLCYILWILLKKFQGNNSGNAHYFYL